MHFSWHHIDLYKLTLQLNGLETKKKKDRPKIDTAISKIPHAGDMSPR